MRVGIGGVRRKYDGEYDKKMYYMYEILKKIIKDYTKNWAG